jgi:flagellar motor switch protein FliG
MDEFRSLLSAPFQYGGSAEGGLDEARRLLYAAFGPARGEALLQKAVPKALANPFDFLEEFSGSQLALLFRDESPAAEALVLSRLPTNLSASVLAHTNYGRKLELVRRIARMGETAPEVLDRAAGALKEKVRHFSPAESPDAGIDGMGVLSAILKASDISFGDRLLDELEYRDPGLGRSLKDRLCTLEDVAAVPDRPIEEKLRSMSDRDIMLLLKNPEDVFTQKIRSNLSHGREERIREDAELAGAVPKIEVQAAAREFLAWFRAEGPWLEEETAENVLAGGGEGL